MYACLACSATPSSSPAPVYVFVDHDNILVEAQKIAAKDFDSDTDHRVHINFKKLGDVVIEGRTLVGKGKVYNCRKVDINDIARFSLVLTESSRHTRRQKQVDTNICVDIMDVLTPTTPSTIVLLSGDCDILPALKKVLEAGWKVEIYAWEHNTAEYLKKLAAENVNCIFKPLDPYFKPLDDEFPDIISYHYYISSIKDEDEVTSVVLTVSCSKFKRDNRVYKTHASWWEKLEEISKSPVQYSWLRKVAEYELNEPKLLLVFRKLDIIRTKDLLPHIPRIAEDIPHERHPEMYNNFKERLEQGRSRSISLTSSNTWSTVATRYSTPRSTPACCLGKNCEDGQKCVYYHSVDERKYFTIKVRGGKGHPYRKTRLCPQPVSHSLPEKCDFAHGPNDGWCIKCHQKGHFKVTCNNSECNHPKHTARQLSQALFREFR